jgi:hypothetical protein
MSEHGWPDFHDDGLHHDDDGGGHHEEPLHHDQQQDDQLHDDQLHHDDSYFDDQHHDDGALSGHDTPEVNDTPGTHAPEIHEAAGHDAEIHGEAASADADPQHELHTVGADPDAVPEPDLHEAVTSFPPVLDVGPLPEPVDGFPWIDTGSLGLVDPATVHAAAAGDAVTPQDLADYAGAELPPGADPWAALADSDDPATSALAKWWSEHS